MQKPMRRADRQLPDSAAYALLQQGEYGILSTVDETGQPYGVPLSYAVEGKTIYFHCAPHVGLKCANLAYQEQACFTVVGRTEVLPEQFSTVYESVIAFGTVTSVEDQGEKRRGLLALTGKYSPGLETQAEAYADRTLATDGVAVYAFHIHSLTGKSRAKQPSRQPEVRHATLADLDMLETMESRCFPPQEAADRVTLAGRLAVYPKGFWLLCLEGEPVAFLNGMATDRRDLTDEMYENPTLHTETGDWQMIFGLDTLPEYRCHGYAGRLLRAAIADAREKGRKGLVLTCKEHLVPYYASFGFNKEGISASVHGGARWIQMRLTFHTQGGDSRKEYL